MTDDAGGPRLSRRALLAAVAGLAGAAAAATDAALQEADESALGGATDAQDRVPVVDLLVILGDETVDVSDHEGVVYHGIDWREGGRLHWPEGATLTLEDEPQ